MGEGNDQTLPYNAVEPHILAIDDCEDKDALWDLFCGVMQDDYGAELISYHHIPSPLAPDRLGLKVMAVGHDPAWVNMYRERELFRIDPIAQAANHMLLPFYWSSIEDRIKLTQEQKDFLVLLRQWLKGDGLAIPAFGPSGRNGYFGIGCREAVPDWSRPDAARIYWAAQAFHTRYCILHMAGLDMDFTLTSRQTQILQHLARGLDTQTIAVLLGSQTDTVDNTIRRILKKMGVTDTGSAILRAVSCGLIEP
ncbi:autoinducer binding domain-containing protein [Fretibacter rubidus]|uniref:helix-turn-helix transcriptional regulator n=1 Tax=Fretibacter rubidus TaxID=570162 RepID=UPI00352A33FA